MKAEKFLDPIGGISDAYLEESEIAAPAKHYGWVKWVAVAACLALAALIAVPAILNSKAQAESIPDTSAPAEALITDEAKEGIKFVLTQPYYERVSEDELASVTLGLPIAEYSLYLDDNGAYYLSSHVYAQIYPVYVDGTFKYLVGPYPPDGAWGWCEPYSVTHISFDGDQAYFDEPLHYEVRDQYQTLYDRLAAGNAGAMTLVYAADGTYVYDGSNFERVCDIGIYLDPWYDTLFDENGNYIDWPDHSVEPPHKVTLANLEGADLPAELVAQIRLTDTAITEPLI